LNYIAPIILSYLLGSITFSFVVGKWMKGIDIRNYGSGNAGATNTLRVMGIVPAITVLLLDLSKGILAVWIGRWFAPEEIMVSILCGLIVIAGHNWPVFFKFKGGKGIATTIGVALSLFFLPTIFAGLIGILAIVLTRYVSLGSILFTAFLPIFIWLMHYQISLLWASLAIALFAILRHKKNIGKLFQGQENKIGSKQHL
jgi:glycerol-3-phosphate acyltransferase PlsY